MLNSMDFTKKNKQISPTETEKRMVEEITRRVGDYAANNIVEQRAKLIEAWREAHPECAKQAPSLKHHTLDKMNDGIVDNPERPEAWFNDIFQVTVRRWSKDKVFGSTGGMIQIGINALDGTARHDWREFQGIKNQIAGPECEGFELYPAESRLLDPSNYYTLWCFPGIRRMNVGLNERRVLRAGIALAPQRAFETEMSEE
jgi:hypothetical protein